MIKTLAIEMKPSEDNNNILQELLSNFFMQKKPPVKINPKMREKEELIANLNQAKKELDIANTNFEFAQDEELVDYFIYKIKAAETRYQYLLKKAKEKNINVANLDMTHIWERKNKIE
ncbi:MAG: hypothetical protein PWP27_2094 [Clostridiales bacterium]|jgi:exonuclease VII small subunit|nr:hypothetical protein [Clostridiales bacterium]MDK2934284.1 hypothetical protein [Clostridiales bacterium]